MASVLSHNICSRWFFMSYYLGWASWKYAPKSRAMVSTGQPPSAAFQTVVSDFTGPSQETEWMPVLGTMGRLRDNKKLSDRDNCTFLCFIVYIHFLSFYLITFLPACCRVGTRKLTIKIPKASPCYLTTNQSEQCLWADHTPYNPHT